jgi:hypothetical protein
MSWLPPMRVASGGEICMQYSRTFEINNSFSVLVQMLVCETTFVNLFSPRTGIPCLVSNHYIDLS